MFMILTNMIVVLISQCLEFYFYHYAFLEQTYMFLTDTFQQYEQAYRKQPIELFRSLSSHSPQVLVLKRVVAR